MIGLPEVASCQLHPAPPQSFTMFTCSPSINVKNLFQRKDTVRIKENRKNLYSFKRFKRKEVAKINKLIATGITAVVLISVVMGIIIFSGLNGKFEDKPLIIIEDNFFYYNGVNITWYGEAAFKLKTPEVIVYIDPYSMGNDSEKADIVIGTHNHLEHLSPSDIGKVADPARTILYTPRPTQVDGFGTTVTVLEALPLYEIYYPDPWEIIEKYGISLEFVPAYNIDKYIPFQHEQLWHPPWANWTGVIIDFGNVRIYHTGDTDHIPEMQQYQCDIALMAINGANNRAMMTAEEAAEATESLIISSKLKFVVPMHYMSPTQLDQVVIFTESTNCTVVVLDPINY